MNRKSNFFIGKMCNERESQLLHDKNLKRSRTTTSPREKREKNKNNNFCMGKK